MAFATDAPGYGGSLARFWQRTYAADYVGFVLLVVAQVVMSLFVEPFHRMFSLDDRTKAYPHALVERVSVGQNILYGGGTPLMLLILWALVARPSFHKAHVTFLGLFVSLLLTPLLTDIVKNAAGRPRPDLLDRCKAKPGTPKAELVTIGVCMETDHHTLHDGWRSFPSGHSSFAFAGLGYLALFLAGQLHTFRPGKDLLRVLIFFIPLVGAGLIAMSRVADYRHDVYDVTAGSVLGMTIAYLSYRRHYRQLRHPKCDEPYPSPADLAERRGSHGQRSMTASEFELEDLDGEAELPLHNHV